MTFSQILNIKIIIFVLVVSSLFAKTEIAIIDTGLSKRAFSDFKDKLCETGHKDFTGEGIYDTNGHGTNIASIIYPHLDSKKECMVILKGFSKTKGWMRNPLDYLINALKYARLKNYAYVNYSISGDRQIYKEFKLIQEMINNKQYFIVAAGNDRTDLSKYCYFYPVCYPIKSKYFFKVGSRKRKSYERLGGSNYNGPINMIAIGENYCYNGNCMSGTSQAAARTTAFLVKRNRK